MANVAKKISWSGREQEEDDGESTPLLNGTSSKDVHPASEHTASRFFRIGQLSTVDLGDENQELETELSSAYTKEIPHNENLLSLKYEVRVIFSFNLNRNIKGT
ncbi:H(+)/Cl(-) exchange transporter 7-like [Discoglossus pictus]